MNHHMDHTPTRRRAIFLDVDGTILHDGRWIPPSAIEAIRAARANGHLIFLSTGRATAELSEELLSIGFDGAVTNGGGFASVDDEIVVSRLLPADAVDRLEQAFAARGVHWYFQSYDRLFASPGLPALMDAYLERDRAVFLERHGADADDTAFFSVGMKVFDDRAHFDAAQMAKAVVLSDDVDAVEALLAELADDFAVVGGTIPLPTGASGEVALSGVDKGTAILDLLAHVGISPDDAIGIGDNWNDVEMFDVCGLSIAMGNAPDGVKARADEVTTAIDDDGIRNALARHGLA